MAALDNEDDFAIEDHEEMDVSFGLEGLILDLDDLWVNFLFLRFFITTSHNNYIMME